jgi:hypothetical protein
LGTINFIIFFTCQESSLAAFWGFPVYSFRIFHEDLIGVWYADQLSDGLPVMAFCPGPFDLQVIKMDKQSC